MTRQAIGGTAETRTVQVKVAFIATGTSIEVTHTTRTLSTAHSTTALHQVCAFRTSCAYVKRLDTGGTVAAAAVTLAVYEAEPVAAGTAIVRSEFAFSTSGVAWFAYIGFGQILACLTSRAVLWREIAVGTVRVTVYTLPSPIEKQSCFTG